MQDTKQQPASLTRKLSVAWCALTVAFLLVEMFVSARVGVPGLIATVLASVISITDKTENASQGYLTARVVFYASMTLLAALSAVAQHPPTVGLGLAAGAAVGVPLRRLLRQRAVD